MPFMRSQVLQVRNWFDKNTGNIPLLSEIKCDWSHLDCPFVKGVLIGDRKGD